MAQNLFYCGANTRVVLRQYFDRGLNKNLLQNQSLSYKDSVLTEAVAIQFIVEQASEPLYSYADTEYVAVADGKVLVLGKLITNISSELGTGYLAEVLGALNPNKNIKEQNTPKDPVMTNIFSKIQSNVPLTSQEINVYANYVTNANNVLGRQVQLEQDRFNTNLLFSKGRIDQHNMGFDLIIEIGDHLDMEMPSTNPPTFKRLQPVRVITLKDVKVKSTQYQIAATSEPIAEIYDFFARTAIYGSR